MLPNMSPQFLGHLIARRRRVVGAVLAVVMALYGLLVLTRPSQYESTASIIVKVGDQDMAMPDLVSEQQARGASATLAGNLAEKLINAAQLIITSEDVLKVALERVGVGKVYPDIALEAKQLKAPVLKIGVDRLLKDTTVTVNINTNVIRLSLFNEDPAVARLTLEALIAATIEKQALITRDPRLKFLESKLQALKVQGDAAQEQVLAFRQKTQITAFYEERSLLLKQRDETEVSLSQLQADLVAAKGRVQAIEVSLGATPERVELSDENDLMQRQIDEAQARVSAAQARYEAGKQRFAAGNPELLDEAAQLRAATVSLRKLRARPTARHRFGVNPLHQELKAELSKARSDVEASGAAIEERQLQLKKISERLGYLDSQELTMRELESQRESIGQEYRSYLQRVQSARIVTDMNIAGISSLGVLQRPTLPYKTARPRKLLLFVLALLAGFVASIGLCLLVERVDSTISLSEDVEAATGLPLLGVIDLRSTK
jgi:uncharacterized protein involved in exopolysaccharide biosynthesis